MEEQVSKRSEVILSENRVKTIVSVHVADLNCVFFVCPVSN